MIKLDQQLLSQCGSTGKSCLCMSVAKIHFVASTSTDQGGKLTNTVLPGRLLTKEGSSQTLCCLDVCWPRREAHKHFVAWTSADQGGKLTNTLLPGRLLTKEGSSQTLCCLDVYWPRREAHKHFVAWTSTDQGGPGKLTNTVLPGRLLTKEGSSQTLCCLDVYWPRREAHKHFVAWTSTDQGGKLTNKLVVTRMPLNLPKACYTGLAPWLYDVSCQLLFQPFEGCLGSSD